MSVSVDNNKFYQESHWTRLKEYIPNTKLSKQEVAGNYWGCLILFHLEAQLTTSP